MPISPPATSSSSSKPDRRTSQTLRPWLNKAALVCVLASSLGIFDDLQVRYFPVARFGNEVEIAYQFLFMGASGAIAFGVLHDGNRSALRNLPTLLMALPVAALADNVSIDMGTLRPYLGLIPREGYVWRQAVFGQTEGLSYVAGWVNQQSVAPSLLNGYVAALAAVAMYVVIEFALTRRSAEATTKPG